MCTDQTIEGVHFEAGAAARHVGRKAAARALSDLAACGARPLGILLALSAPASCSEARIRGLIEGARSCAVECGADLVGGDLACAEGPVHLAVTALGVLAGRRRPPARDRARVGQIVLLSGPVGGSGLGRHLEIQPRIREGRWLHASGATAMMDVSDGLAWDLFRLARASGVAIELDNVPAHRDARRAAAASGHSAEWHALNDGEDHELIATLDPARRRAVFEQAPRACPGLVEIGRVCAGSGLLLRRGGKLERWTSEGGWRHGE